METIYYKQCIICGNNVESKCLCETHYFERLNFIHGLKSWKKSFFYNKENYAPYLFDMYEGIKETLSKNILTPQHFHDSLCILLYSISEILEYYSDGFSSHIITPSLYPDLEEKTKQFIFNLNNLNQPNSTKVPDNSNNNSQKSPISEPITTISQEYFDFRTQYPLKYRCTDGHFVRSKAEREIDNFLFNQNIIHVYEWHYISPNGKEYFPDFYIPQYHLILEYFGLNKENYLKTKAEKINTYTSDNRYNFEYLLPEHDNDLEFYLMKIIQKYKK